MLTCNLWAEQGLANGTVGHVHSILFDSGDEPSSSLPQVVMIVIRSYKGPTLWFDSEGIKLVPITPVKVSWEHNGVKCSHTQLPLQLAFAITMHKSQGMTLDKAIVNLGEREFSRGLTFVALSQVRTIEGLAIKPGFDLQRLMALSKGDDEIQQDEARRNALGFCS